jgi:hypothetical protein
MRRFRRRAQGTVQWQYFLDQESNCSTGVLQCRSESAMVQDGMVDSIVQEVQVREQLLHEEEQHLNLC